MLLHISNKGDVDHVPDEPEGKWLHWPTLAAYVGPGFLVCIAYLDPGNLEADLQVRTGLPPHSGTAAIAKGCSRRKHPGVRACSVLVQDVVLSSDVQTFLPA